MDLLSTPTGRLDLPSRILDAARHLLFSEGAQSLTMDSLAGSLGISKKTLYLHFPGKDAILCALVDHFSERLRSRMEAILADKKRSVPERLCALVEVVGTTASRLTPAFLRELQRNAPAVYERIDTVRRKNIPFFFGTLLRDGLAEGSLRADIDPDFAVEFWLQAVRGLLSPDSLERTQLTAKQTLQRGIDLFFNGLLTPAGREQYKRHVSACRNHSL